MQAKNLRIFDLTALKNRTHFFADRYRLQDSKIFLSKDLKNLSLRYGKWVGAGFKPVPTYKSMSLFFWDFVMLIF